MRLTEKHRPRSLDTVAGQDRAVKQIRTMQARPGGLGGRAYWISGPTGTGKTTIARIMAADLADAHNVIEYDAGSLLCMADIDAIDSVLRMSVMGVKGGRVWIVNEAHGMRGPVIQAMLGLLERIPDGSAIVFTTTWEGEDQLDGGVDSRALVTRCSRIALTNQGQARPYAERAHAIATSEGLNGKPIEAYLKLAEKCKNSMRAMLQMIEDGAMAEA